MTRVIYSFVNIALIFSMHAAVSTSAAAKDRPPEPIEKPGECPIDLPVRVASIDSLRHFEGLIGHCPETAVIESRAWRANPPRTVRDRDADDRDLIPAWQIPSGGSLDTDGLIIAGNNAPQPQGGKGATERTSRTRSIVSRDGTQVAIIPAPGQFHDEVPSVAAGGDTAGAGTADEVEAVLALRPRSYATAFDQSIANAARTHGVDPLLLHAVIKQESAYRAAATSHAGARGLMQVMPATGRSLGVRDPGHLYDPATNSDAGARLLSQLWRNFDGNIDLVLAAYNAGEGAVRKHGNTVPPYRETRDYVAKVKLNYKQLAAESGLAVNF